MGVNWMTRLLKRMCKLIIELAFLAITLAYSYQYMPEYLSYESSTLLDIYLNESPIYMSIYGGYIKKISIEKLSCLSLKDCWFYNEFVFILSQVLSM